jgi:hypothetical protein
VDYGYFPSWWQHVKHFITGGDAVLGLSTPHVMTINFQAKSILLQPNLLQIDTLSILFEITVD